LECKGFDDTGRLVAVPCADPDPLPTGCAVRYCDGETEYAFAATAPEWFVRQVVRHDIGAMITRPDAVVQRLRTDGHGVVVDHFHSYCFDDIPATEHSAITRDGAESYSMVVDGHRVAGAASSRSDDVSAELWIQTDPAHRRRGYALALARAWAAGVREAGKVAFYSHLHENQASAALARRLGVRPLFEIVALELT
jgi:GNAT superfamily N-acetyltransferase